MGNYSRPEIEVAGLTDRPVSFYEGMDVGIPGFFLLIIVIGDKAKCPVAVHGDTTPEKGDGLILRLDCRPAHIEVAKDIGSNSNFVAIA
ncbi:hypothetical protein ES703_112139 [subsurface metagenome]